MSQGGRELAIVTTAPHSVTGNYCLKSVEPSAKTAAAVVTGMCSRLPSFLMASGVGTDRVACIYVCFCKAESLGIAKSCARVRAL